MALFDAARERLAYYKLPGYVAFLPELPLTASNKLQRGALRAAAERAVSEGSAFDLRTEKKRPVQENHGQERHPR
ncbi:acyl-CoA synthetase [compost metagenome]